MIKTRKAEELDIVELTEDLPQYGVRKGEQAVVITAFDEPDEAYDLELIDESGTSSRFAYSVKPGQIKSTDDIAKDIFERGIHLLNNGKLLEAEREFRRAIRLKPDYLGVLHNSTVKSFEGSDEWQRMITAMSIVFRINPEYEIARRNLAIAYQEYGMQKENEGDIGGALELFQMALSLGPPAEIISDIRNSLAAVFTSQGIRAHEHGDLMSALRLMGQANMVDPNERTRRNLGIAWIHLAQSCLDKDDLHNAIIAFERAELTGLASPQLLNDYGFALAHDGQVDEAIGAFERALELSPENEIIQSNLASVKSNVMTDLGKEKINAEFVSDFTTERIAAKTDMSVNFQTPVYPIDLRNLVAA